MELLTLLAICAGAVALLSRSAPAAPSAPAKGMDVEAVKKAVPNVDAVLERPDADPQEAAEIAERVKVQIGPARIRVAPPSASEMAAELRAKGKRYDHGRLAAYQRAKGLKPDGLYGELTRSQLQRDGEVSLPAPFAKRRKP